MNNVRMCSGIVFVAVIAVTLSAGMCFATPGNNTGVQANVWQGQNQDYNGFSSVVPHSGLTFHYGNQDQESEGFSSGWNSGVSANQYQEEGHEYGSVSGGQNNWTGQGGFNEMSAQMQGYTHGFGIFSADGNQNYFAIMDTSNIGPNSAASGMEDSFYQGVFGGVFGQNVWVNNSLNLSAGNSYAQLATSGNDWVLHSGESSTNSFLNGNARQYGFYNGSVTGFQTGRINTIQSGNGNYQSGVMNASANLTAGTQAFGNSNVQFGAIMDQTHFYQQHNAGPDGYQYGEGTVTTHVAFGGNN